MENDLKLCGFLQAVLSAPSPPQTLPPGAPCSLFANGPNVGFRSQDGALFLPLPERPPGEDAAALAATSTPDGTVAASGSGSVTPASSASKRRRRRVAGLVNVSVSVVHQLHALTAHKCLQIDAKVVRVSTRGDGAVRAVVLIDLYLPIAAWSGWQFPRSGALAGSLFKHARLFPHQEAAVEWMLNRERHSVVLAHPLYMGFSTEDGFTLYMNSVSGEVFTGMAPTVCDFRGGMFCDEPGLGKTVTALSLILKTHGTVADPPHGVDVVWCMHNVDRKCGYYELGADNLNPTNLMSIRKRSMAKKLQRGEAYFDKSLPKASLFENSSSLPHDRGRSMDSGSAEQFAASSCWKSDISSCINDRAAKLGVRLEWLEDGVKTITGPIPICHANVADSLVFSLAKCRCISLT